MKRTNLNGAALELKAAGVTCVIDMKDSRTARLRASVGEYQIVIVREGNRQCRVTILSPRGYVCCNTPTESDVIAAQWALACADMRRAAARSQRITDCRVADRSNPWRGTLSRVSKAQTLCGHVPRSPEASQAHTATQFAYRFQRRLGTLEARALLKACTPDTRVETQLTGREVHCVSYEGFEVMVVTAPERTYLVTVLRTFEYVALRTARHLLNRPARQVRVQSSLNSDSLRWVMGTEVLKAAGQLTRKTMTGKTSVGVEPWKRTGSVRSLLSA